MNPNNETELITSDYYLIKNFPDSSCKRNIMGKKMGINTKSVAAKERKNEKAAAEKAAKDAAIEDAKWRDDGNPLAKKQVSHYELKNLFYEKFK